MRSPAARFGAKWIYLKQHLKVRNLTDTQAQKAIPLLEELIRLTIKHEK